MSQSVSDTTFSTQTNNTNKLLGAILAAIQKVAIIPAPAAGAVGSYALAKATTATAFGATISGAVLTPSNAAGSAAGAALSGTWMCMGTIGAAGDVSLFVRTA